MPSTANSSPMTGQSAADRSDVNGQVEAVAAASAAKIPSPVAGPGSRFHIPRPAKHWTPRYIKNRLKLAWWQRQNPDAPWLTEGAVTFLDHWLKPGDVVGEFGSGRSTLYFSRKVGVAGLVCSVEHHKQWFDEVTQRLARATASNVRYFNPAQEEGAYTGAADAGLAGRRPDLVLVDGLYRDACALWAARAVRPGGIVAIDNVQRYLPHQTFAPFSIPASGRPATAKWGEFWSAAGSWRKHWTSNGIEDTAFFFKPAD